MYLHMKYYLWLHLHVSWNVSKKTYIRKNDFDNWQWKQHDIIFIYPPRCQCATHTILYICICSSRINRSNRVCYKQLTPCRCGKPPAGCVMCTGMGRAGMAQCMSTSLNYLTGAEYEQCRVLVLVVLVLEQSILVCAAFLVYSSRSRGGWRWSPVSDLLHMASTLQTAGRRVRPYPEHHVTAAGVIRQRTGLICHSTDTPAC